MLKLKRFNKGQWFSYPKAEGVEFLIRPLHLSDSLRLRSEIRKSVAIDVIEPKSKKMVTTLMEDINTGEFSFKSFNEMLMDFRGPISIEDDEGNEISVVEGMSPSEVERIKDLIKVALFDDESVRDFIVEKAGLLLDKENEKFQEEQKNLKSLQDG